MELPDELTTLECHLTWIHKLREACSDSDFLTDLTQSSLKREDVKRKCIAESYKTHDAHDLDKNDLQYNCDPIYYPNFARSFALQMNTCAHMLSVGHLKDACLILTRLRTMLGMLPEEHKDRLLPVMEYYVECLEWYKDKLSGIHVDAVNKQANLQERWDSFESDKKSFAVRIFVRTIFCRYIPGGVETRHLERLEEVIDFDPDYHLWYQYGYESMRKVRIYHSQDKAECPSTLETYYCEAAYDLAPNAIPNILNHGIMLKDCLRGVSILDRESNLVHVGSRTEDFTETLNQCLILLNEARCTAAEQKMPVWYVSSSLEISDLQLHVIQTEQSFKESIKLLHELLEMYPNNAVIHHKLGKMHRFGLKTKDGSRIFRDDEMARNYFKIALDLRQNNYFNVLGDYIKLFQYLPAPQPSLEALQILRQAWENVDYFNVIHPENDILIWTGLILWIYNPEGKKDSKREACEEWLGLFDSDPEPSERQDELLRRIWRPSFFIPVNGRRVEFKMSTDKLKEELLKISEDSSTSSSMLAVVEVFLKEIAKNPQHFSLPSARSRNPEIGLSLENNWRRRNTQEFLSSGKGETWRMQRPPCKNFAKSIADQDDNWRK